MQSPTQLVEIHVNDKLYYVHAPWFTDMNNSNILETLGLDGQVTKRLEISNIAVAKQIICQLQNDNPNFSSDKLFETLDNVNELCPYKTLYDANVVPKTLSQVYFYVHVHKFLASPRQLTIDWSPLKKPLCCIQTRYPELVKQLISQAHKFRDTTNQWSDQLAQTEIGASIIRVSQQTTETAVLCRGDLVKYFPHIRQMGVNLITSLLGQEHSESLYIYFFAPSSHENTYLTVTKEPKKLLSSFHSLSEVEFLGKKPIDFEQEIIVPNDCVPFVQRYYEQHSSIDGLNNLLESLKVTNNTQETQIQVELGRFIANHCLYEGQMSTNSFFQDFFKYLCKENSPLSESVNHTQVITLVQHMGWQKKRVSKGMVMIGLTLRTCDTVVSEESETDSESLQSNQDSQSNIDKLY
jgi:hypothetical protein